MQLIFKTNQLVGFYMDDKVLDEGKTPHIFCECLLKSLAKALLKKRIK